MAAISRMLSQGILFLIQGYRYIIRPFMGYRCRFYPSCSCYAEEAIKKYGVGKGGYLSMRRLLRCHPWHSGGVDVVPHTLKK